MSIASNTATSYVPGDWICWRTMSGLRISAVVYVRESTVYPYVVECVTQDGTVAAEDVLEFRPSLPPSTPATPE